MNWKKFLISLLAVWLVLELSSYFVHMIFLKGEYMSESFKDILRPKDQLASNMWLIWMADFVWSAIFILIYRKGFRKKGIIDAVKYGVYIGIFSGFVNSFKTYALSPFPYIVIFYWFFFFMIQSILLALIVYYLYKKEPMNN